MSHLLNGPLSGLDCAPWTMCESGAVTCAEGYQAANEISGTLMCTDDEVAGMRFWRLQYRSACRSLVRLMTRPQVSEMRAVTFRIRSVVWSLAQRVVNLVGSISTTFLLCLSLGGFVSEVQTVYSLCSQMFCSDISVQGGVGVKPSRKGVFIWFRRQSRGLVRKN